MHKRLFGSNELDSLPFLYTFLYLCIYVRCWVCSPPSAERLIGVCVLISAQQLFQKLKNLMRPYSVEFESPLELSAQGGSEQTCKRTQKAQVTRTRAYGMNISSEELTQNSCSLVEKSISVSFSFHIRCVLAHSLAPRPLFPHTFKYGVSHVVRNLFLLFAVGPSQYRRHNLCPTPTAKKKVVSLICTPFKPTPLLPAGGSRDIEFSLFNTV